jgi:hypothetical protein
MSVSPHLERRGRDIMAVLEIYQQSLIGDIIKFPYTLVKFILMGILKILLFPYYVVKFTLFGIAKIISWLLPDFYEENLLHSFKGWFCWYKFLFFLVSFMVLIVLLPLHFLPLLGSHKIFASTFLRQFDLVQSLLVLGKTFVIAELLFLVLALAGFLVSFGLTFLLITAYSMLKFLIEFVNTLTSNRFTLILTFIIALIIFGVVYLIVTETIPL